MAQLSRNPIDMTFGGQYFVLWLSAKVVANAPAHATRSVAPHCGTTLRVVISTTSAESPFFLDECVANRPLTLIENLRALFEVTKLMNHFGLSG